MSICGTLVETLTFPVDAPAGLSALVSVASQTLTVATGVTTAMISENIVTYTASYPNCATSTVDTTFTLTVECTTGSDIELTATDSTALTFNFIDDTDVTLAFEYTHAYCDPHAVTFMDSTTSTELTWITSSLTDTTLTITATPTLYSDVGEYTIDAVFTDPLSSTKTGIFTLSVVDPCDFSNANMVVTSTFTPALASYAIDDAEVSYSVEFSDTISDFFVVDDVCGVWTYASLTDDQASADFSTAVTASGDSSALTLTI